jgi:hypothetical protein
VGGGLMALDLPAVMEGMAEALSEIDGLRTYPFPPDTVNVPAAVVSFPDEVNYDLTAGRGSDRLELPVHVLVGKVSDRASAGLLGLYLSVEGESSVKDAVEADTTLDGAAQTVRVVSASVSVITVNGVDYLAATFTIDVVA